MCLAAHGNVSACGNSLCSRRYTTICDVICTTLILCLCLLDGVLGIYNCFWTQPPDKDRVARPQEAALLSLYGALQIQFAFVFGMLLYFRIWIFVRSRDSTKDADINLPNEKRWPDVYPPEGEAAEQVAVILNTDGRKTHFLGARVYGYMCRTILWTVVTFGWIPLGFINHHDSIVGEGGSGEHSSGTNLEQIGPVLGTLGLVTRQAMATVALLTAFPAYFGLLDSCWHANADSCWCTGFGCPS